MNAEPPNRLPFRRSTTPATNCAVPPNAIAIARVGPAPQYPTLCNPVAMVVVANPIKPTTAGFAHHSLCMPGSMVRTGSGMS